VIHKEKIRKIVKFEKIMKKFCREIGIDKKILMAMMVGKDNINDSSVKKNFYSSEKD